MVMVLCAWCAEKRKAWRIMQQRLLAVEEEEEEEEEWLIFRL